MNAIEKWIHAQEVILPVWALKRAVKSLEKIEALALIRAVFQEELGSQCTLEHAKEIWQSIVSS